MFGGKAILAFVVFWLFCLCVIHDPQFMAGLTFGGIFCGVVSVVLMRQANKKAARERQAGLDLRE